METQNIFGFYLSAMMYLGPISCKILEEFFDYWSEDKFEEKDKKGMNDFSVCYTNKYEILQAKLFQLVNVI